MNEWIVQHALPYHHRCPHPQHICSQHDALYMDRNCHHVNKNVCISLIMPWRPGPDDMTNKKVLKRL